MKIVHPSTWCWTRSQSLLKSRKDIVQGCIIITFVTFLLSCAGLEVERKCRYGLGIKALRGWGIGRGYPLPQPTRGSGRASWAPPVGSGAQPLLKTILVHSEGARTALVAMHVTEMTKALAIKFW